jgi:hypothetical protein
MFLIKKFKQPDVRAVSRRATKYMELSSLISLLFAGSIFQFSMCCKSPDTGQIINVPDSVLIHFSYSLFPEDQLKETIIMHDGESHITQTIGPFTEKDSTEILVSVPFKSAYESFSKLFIVSVIGNQFEFQEWFNKDCTAFSKVDLHNDGINEIITQHEGTISGTLHYKIYEILSLRGGKPKVIYQRYSETGNEPANFGHSQIGDTLSIWFNNNLIDRDQDGIPEMMETIQCFTISEIVSADSVKSSMHLDTLTFNFKRTEEYFQ